MSELTEQKAPTTLIAPIALIVTVALLMIFAVISAIQSIYWMNQTQSVGGAAFYAIALVIASLVAAIWTLFLYVNLRIALRTQIASESSAHHIERLESLLEDIARSARKQVELTALSDQSKSLLFRDREIEAFRETIHEDLMRQDYRSAQALIDTIENRLGYVEEAARLRAEVEASQKATLQEKIDQAISRVKKTLEQKDWPRALREAKRLVRLFPHNNEIAALPGQVEAARVGHKRDLLESYGDAVRKNDVDRGIEMLKELDTYLTPQEAAALEESARGVFRAKLQHLGVQFALRVTEGQWSDAIVVGEEIVREFPNSRMAQEVRQKMDSLKAKAAVQEPAKKAAQAPATKVTPEPPKTAAQEPAKKA